MALKAVSAPLGSPVGGSGTPGTIPVWSGSGTTLGDSPLTVSGTTVTATQAFTVNGTQTFNGNLVSGFNQTWTLNGGFLNIQSGLLYLDKTNSRIGIGTASPAAKMQVEGSLICGTGGSANSYGHSVFGPSSAYTMWWRTTATAGGGIIGSAGPGLQFYVVSGSPSSPTFSQAAAIDSSGRLLVGTTTSPTSSAAKLVVNAAGGVLQYLYDSTASRGAYLNAYTNTLEIGGVTGALGTESTTTWARVTSTALDASFVTGYGLKLPATPGNPDTQTLDCYAEGTWTPTVTGFGGTAPTVTGRYTRVGRLVTLSVLVSATGGAQFSSTATTTYISLPSGMTPTTASQPGATSNSGIAADGPCVAYTNGNLYLPTFALRTADTFLTVTYMI
jgi:hypothetical protein